MMMKFLKTFWLLFLILTAFSCHRQYQLPPEESILIDHNFQPMQSNRDESEFKFMYAGKVYGVKPQAHYELRGLIVTTNNIYAFDDIYHDETSVDLKDICVVWGTNLREKLYKGIEFWSEPWTCNWKTKDDDLYAEFRGDMISNNHLLASDPAVQEKIRSLGFGDQVKVTGKLVDYYPAGQPDRARKSSLIRTDEGDGACEVFFVENIEILKAPNEIWRKLFKLGQWGSIATLLAIVALFIKNPG